MGKYNLTLQPFIVAVGPMQNLEAVYVVINNQKYKFQDVTHAVDFCFKSFYTLKAKYPTSCEIVWTFLQKKMYGIKDTQTNYQSVQKVSDQLDLCVNDSDD